MAQMVKNLPTMQETRLLSLSREDCLEKAMGTHSSFLAWGIPLTEEPGGLVYGVTKGQTWLTDTFTFIRMSVGKMCPLKLQVWEHTLRCPRSYSLQWWKLMDGRRHGGQQAERKQAKEWELEGVDWLFLDPVDPEARTVPFPSLVTWTHTFSFYT